MLDWLTPADCPVEMQQIADATSSPTNTVKTRLHYARRKLFAWIESENVDIRFVHLNASTGQSALAL